MTFRIRLRNKYLSFPHFVVISILSLSTFHFIIDLCLGKSFEETKLKLFPQKIPTFRPLKLNTVRQKIETLNSIIFAIFLFMIKENRPSFPLLRGWRLNEYRELVVHCFVSAFPGFISDYPSLKIFIL